MTDPNTPKEKKPMIAYSVLEPKHEIRRNDVVSAYLGGKTVAELQKMFPNLSESEIHNILAKGHDGY